MNKHEIIRIANSLEMAQDMSEGNDHLVNAVRYLFEAVLSDQYRSEFHGSRHRDELTFEGWCHENGYWTYCQTKPNIQQCDCLACQLSDPEACLKEDF